MTADDLIAAFDTLADAPDGVKRLRELVLQLAIRGKLVVQDPRDESAQDLLRRVIARRATVGGRASKGGPLARGEIPFDVPESWTWVRFGDVFECRLGKMLDKAKNRGSLHSYLRNANVRWGSFDLSDVREMRIEEHEIPDVTVCKGDLVICEGGEPGRSAVWQLEQPFVIQKALHRARPYLVDSRYFQIHLRVDCASGRVAELFTGATIMHLTGQVLDKHTVTVPPLAEQHRIVARVDELMGLLDRLESAQTTLDEVRRAARDAALAALRDAEDTVAVEAAWHRIAGQMDTVFVDAEDVGAFRQVVLQLAMRGQLTEQMPDDEPASALLSRIARERRSRHDPRKKYVEPAFREQPSLTGTVPPGWDIASIEALTDPVRTVSYGILMPGEDIPGGVPYVKVKDMRLKEGDIMVDQVRRTTAEIHRKYLRSELRAGDALVSIRGTVGKVALVPKSLQGGNITQDSARLAFIEPKCVPFMILAMRSPAVREYWAESSKGAAVQGLNIGDLRPTPIPIPPLAEQQRIVAKVDALMTICEDLEVRLTAARDLHTQFAAAAVHHLDV